MPEYIKDTECSRDTPVIWGKTLGSFLWHR